MKELISIGEALIDFIPTRKGCSLSEVEGFTRVCGGAPANVAAAVAKLGLKSKMITQLGIDGFGDYIVRILDEVGVDTSCILRTKEANTSLAFVSLMEDGNRDFSFYRNPGSDMLLDKSDLQEEWFDNCGVLHFCSVDLIEAPIKYAHIEAIKIAKEKGALISFDPNIRLPLWDSEENCKKTVLEFLPYADILKVSDEEIEFIFDTSDTKKAADMAFEQGISLFMCTMGKDGAVLMNKNASADAKCIEVKVADTTGAGDSIMGALIYCLLKNSVNRPELLTEEELSNFITFANYYSTYGVMRHGAIASYATLDEINEFISTH